MPDSEPKSKNTNGNRALALTGFLLVPALWIGLKQFGLVSDRYLPAPEAVLRACFELEPNIFVHLAYTAVRLACGFTAGVAAGIALGITITRSKTLSYLISPMLDSMRSVPAIAIVPFFLLWFGFSEHGKILLIVTGIAFNIAISVSQVLREIPEKHRIMFKSFGLDPNAMTRDYSIPRILETLLPTIRFSLSTAIGVVIVSELLGSQVGLGYVVQTARSTFSMHVIFLATILLGILSAIVDRAVTMLWNRSIYWR